jgi:hypothetical protein
MILLFSIQLGKLKLAFLLNSSRTNHKGGDKAVSLTIKAVGLDELHQVGYHLTNINLQLSKNSEPFFVAHSPA